MLDLLEYATSRNHDRELLIINRRNVTILFGFSYITYPKSCFRILSYKRLRGSRAIITNIAFA
jgi:hypothetical protein